MFNPSQEDVRRFFCAVHAKSAAAQPMDALETLAGQWLQEHPEYHPELGDAEAAVAKAYDGQDGAANPFLHLSMHLSISEQCSIDQPRGIRQAVELLAARRMARPTSSACSAAPRNKTKDKARRAGLVFAFAPKGIPRPLAAFAARVTGTCSRA